jgi:hypothetical protein
MRLAKLLQQPRKAKKLAARRVVGRHPAKYLSCVVTNQRNDATPVYEPPVVKVVGSIHELTLGGCKNSGGSDGFWLLTPSNTLGSC